MSITNGFYTGDDGEVIRLSAVIMVEPMQGNNGGSHYQVIVSSGDHFSVRESYYSRANFITEWKAS
jgi:hypothetical protein